MNTRIFKRKIYNQFLQWKQESNGRTALLVEGARRVGKSTIVEEFARHEYKSYLLIDFNRASADTKRLIEDLTDLDIIFLTQGRIVIPEEADIRLGYSTKEEFVQKLESLGKILGY